MWKSMASMHTSPLQEVQDSIVKHRYTFLLFVYRSVSTYGGDDERATCRWRHYIRKRWPLLDNRVSICGISESMYPMLIVHGQM